MTKENEKKLINLDDEKKKKEILKPKIPRTPEDLKDQHGKDLDLIMD